MYRLQQSVHHPGGGYQILSRMLFLLGPDLLQPFLPVGVSMPQGVRTALETAGPKGFPPAIGVGCRSFTPLFLME
jgi:hypothetical protein